MREYSKFMYLYCPSPTKNSESMKWLFILTVSVMTAAIASAQSIEIPLWPGGAGESNGIEAPEERRENWDVYNISEASLYVWPADGERNTGKAILLCPGGGYGMQAAGHEGRQFARWFAANGITAAVLKYRLPNGHSEIPVADARQAMKLLREKAGELGFDPARVGVAGFSAGGHLASTLLTRPGEGSGPAFGILFYPVVTMTETTHGWSRGNLLGTDPAPEAIRLYSNEMQVTSDTPPTMIFFSDDDTVVDPRNGTMFYDALKQNSVAAAMYVFPSGGHGWGFNPGFEYHEQMKGLTLDWIGKFRL